MRKPRFVRMTLTGRPGWFCYTMHSNHPDEGFRIIWGHGDSAKIANAHWRTRSMNAHLIPLDKPWLKTLEDS